MPIKSEFKRALQTKTGKYQFDYLSGPAGSAKSEAIINMVCDKVSKLKENYIFAIPGIAAAKEIEQRFISKGIIPKIINSTTVDSISVGMGVSNWMESIDPGDGCVLIITHSALNNIAYYPGNAPKHEWNLVHDEAFDPTVHIELNLAYHKDYISDVIKLPSKKEQLEYSSVRYCGHKTIAQQIAIIRNTLSDDIYTLLYDFNQSVLRLAEKKCDIFVHTEDYINFQNGTGKKFVATTVYNPTVVAGFKSVLFAGANFEQELIYTLWRDYYNVTWTESNLKDKLRFQTHNSPVRVKYIIDGDEFNWSKYKANTIVDGKTVIEMVNEISIDLFKHVDEVLWLGNKSTKPKSNSFVSCEYNNHGLNKYSSFSNMVYSGAFNRQPSYYRFMEWVGCEESVKVCQSSGHLYQSILRTAIRKADKEIETVIFVPAKSMFLPIEHLFTNIIFEEVDHPMVNIINDACFDKRKTRYTTKKAPKARMEKWRALAKLKAEIDYLCERGDIEVPINPIPVCEDIDDTLTNSPFGVFANLYDKSGYTIHINDMLNIEEHQRNDVFAAYFSTKDTIIEQKTDNMLFGAFTLKNGANSRRRENISSVFGQFIDFDTSKFKYKIPGKPKWQYTNDLNSIPSNRTAFETLNPISIDDVMSIIGIETRVAYHSTYSGGNRRRVFFLYDRACTPMEHLGLAMTIYNKFKKRFPDCGIDKACIRPETLVYAPCQSKDGTNIFIDKGIDAFDVDQYMSFCIIAKVEPDYLLDRPPVVKKPFTRTFEKAVMPFINEMKPGNRFIMAQKAVGACASVCPGDKYRLEAALISAGCAESQVSNLMSWFDKIS